MEGGQGGDPGDVPGRSAKVSLLRVADACLSHSIMTRALDDLPNLLGPLLEGIGKSLKMHVSVFIGGPEPILKGQINAIRSVLFIIQHLLWN